MIFTRFRLQDAIATVLVLVFGASCAATVWHLAGRFQEIEVRANEARQQLNDWVSSVQPGTGAHAVTTLENHIDAKQRDRQTQEEKAKVADAAVANEQADLDRIRKEAVDKELIGLGPFDAGPAPPTWGPRILYSRWWKWKAKKKLMDSLNNQYEKHEAYIRTLRTVVFETKQIIGIIDAEISRLRDLKNTTQEIFRDPRQREELLIHIKQSTTAQTTLFFLHIPIALYFFVLFMRALFRLLILREWLGEKRLCHAG
ncbi:MAG: hypothetical protein AAB263_01835 [Planctomycetota bacterium]